MTKSLLLAHHLKKAPAGSCTSAGPPEGRQHSGCQYMWEINCMYISLRGWRGERCLRRYWSFRSPQAGSTSATFIHTSRQCDNARQVWLVPGPLPGQCRDLFIDSQGASCSQGNITCMSDVPKNAGGPWLQLLRHMAATVEHNSLPFRRQKEGQGPTSLTASMAATFIRFIRSAPEKPAVARDTLRQLIFSSSCLPRECTLRMSIRPSTLG
jgi:hypothetical protein